MREARRLGMPVVALVDTNCDPDDADFVIPGNDDAIRSCSLVVRVIADGMRQAGKTRVTEPRRWSPAAERRGRRRAAAAKREGRARAARPRPSAEAQAAASAEPRRPPQPRPSPPRLPAEAAPAEERGE